jgi:hypothetical protein
LSTIPACSDGSWPRDRHESFDVRRSTRQMVGAKKRYPLVNNRLLFRNDTGHPSDHATVRDRHGQFDTHPARQLAHRPIGVRMRILFFALESFIAEANQPIDATKCCDPALQRSRVLKRRTSRRWAIPSKSMEIPETSTSARTILAPPTRSRSETIRPIPRTAPVTRTTLSRRRKRSLGSTAAVADTLTERRKGWRFDLGARKVRQFH